MKEDTRKKIPLPPLVYDRFMALKGDDETSADFVERCTDILSDPDREMKNEHIIGVGVDPGDYDYMRFVLGIDLPQPLDSAYLEGNITMLVDLRALSSYTGENVSTVRPERDIFELKRREGQTAEDASREFFAALQAEE